MTATAGFRTTADAAPVTIVSFGYGHGLAPEAHATFDVRHLFRDPHVDPALRSLTAADAPVYSAVLATPGIAVLVEGIACTARAFLSGPRSGPVVIAVGCVGGRHRSAAISIAAARLLESQGTTVAVAHRDMSRPVIARPSREGRPA